METLETIHALMKVHHKQYRIDQKATAKVLGEIVTQAKETNGHVAENTAFKDKIKGGMIVVGSLGITGIVVSFVALFKVISG